MKYHFSVWIIEASIGPATYRSHLMVNTNGNESGTFYIIICTKRQTGVTRYINRRLAARCQNAMARQEKEEKPDNFSWLIENVLAGSALPYRVGHFQYLLNHGIRHLVTLTEFKPPMHLAPPGLAHVFMPVVEFEAPSVEQLETFVSLVDTTRERKEAVVVHCHWGRGRTGTMLAAYLVKDQGMDAQTAIREVRRLRPRSVETREQEGAVANYAKKLKSSQAGTY